jgi:hypothetical protein
LHSISGVQFAFGSKKKMTTPCANLAKSPKKNLPFVFEGGKKIKKIKSLPKSFN